MRAMIRGGGGGRSNGPAEVAGNSSIPVATTVPLGLLASATEVVALTDSLLVVEQVRGKWECHAGNLLPLLGRVIRLMDRFEAARVGWLPRARNRAAHDLVAALLRAGGSERSTAP